MREKKPNWPYPRIDHFPGRFERFSYRTYNWLENRIWPVRPVPFLAIITTATGYQLRNCGLSDLQTNWQIIIKPFIISIGSVYTAVFVLRHFLKYFYFSYKGFLKENPKKPSFLTMLWGALRKTNLVLINSERFVFRIVSEMMDRNDKSTGFLSKIGALTTDKRTEWSINRQKFFLENKNNKKLLEVIETAQFVTSVDDSVEWGVETTEQASQYMKDMITGDGTNRWFDKTMNYAVCANGRGGATGEHSPCDGAELDHLCENFLNIDKQILKSPSKKQQLENAKITEKDKKELKMAEKLEFEVVNGMKEEVERCYDSHMKATDDLHMHSMIFLDFGKGRLKKCGISPDGFVQMAIQLAYYKDQGIFTQTYEPGSVRFYANSRTETLRPVTEASCDFVKSVMDEKSTREIRRKLLKNACEVHVNNCKEIMLGNGVDRHLFILCVIAKGLGYSSPFLDFYASQKWLLSTSNIPNMTNSIDEDSSVDKIMLGGSFGAVAQDGYGICYRFGGNQAILVHVTSYHSSEITNSDRIGAHLKEAFHTLADLFED
ncbi:Protein CBG11458 [Caenorhabditis briggsae]|uniref:Protein CBG11458 n=1 Tax=Caenorhabditis briggsae TaxID=6238 RepID=A8XCZ0_CAEBR|nr:Protein CBG11458 [Caenorhabditis briggsae]CAP30508.2 Protein CBG11458 [Caenorhabditis briggsae]